MATVICFKNIFITMRRPANNHMVFGPHAKLSLQTIAVPWRHFISALTLYHSWVGEDTIIMPGLDLLF